jgi:magnesium transporter
MKILDIYQDLKDVTESSSFGGSYYWIIADVSEIDRIDSIVELDASSVDECRDFNQASRISFFDGYIFLVLNIMSYWGKSVCSKELNIFLGKDYIITVYKDYIDLIDEFLKDIENSKNCFILKDKPQPCILLYYILDRIIVKNYSVISEMEAEADKIEISILRNPKHDQVDQLINLRRQVYKVRKYLNPLRYIGDSLISNDNSIIEKKSINYFVGLNNKIDKLMSSLESLVQDLALVREAFESEIANKTNELMKVFTLIATIFLPLNLITSMYGMDLKHIPLRYVDYGYYYVIAIMLLVVLWLIYIFKRKKWL